MLYESHSKSSEHHLEKLSKMNPDFSSFVRGGSMLLQLIY